MIFIYIAAVAAVVMGIVHSTLGERLVFPRLFAWADLLRLRGSLEFTRSVLRWAWHLLSLTWLGFAWLLFAIGSGHSPDAVTLARIIAVVFGVSGVIAFVTTRGRHIA